MGALRPHAYSLASPKTKSPTQTQVNTVSLECITTTRVILGAKKCKEFYASKKALHTS